MKLQKIILYAAIGLTAFGIAIGLMEIGRYVGKVFQPLKTEIKPLPMPSVVYAPPIVESKQPITNHPDSNSQTEKESCDWGGTGEYSIIGQNPKGFEDFDSLSIMTNDYDEKLSKIVPVKPTGLIQMTKEFKFTWLNIADKRISFVTQTKKGLSYQFDGKFNRQEIKLKDESGDEYTEYVLLSGHLSKWRSGVKIAEAKVKFTEFCGC